MKKNKKKQMEIAVEEAVNSFEKNTPNEARFEHEGVIKVNAVIDLIKIQNEFENTLYFEIKDRTEFDYQVKAFTHYFIANKLGLLGFRVPEVIELDLNIAGEERLDEIGYVVFSIDDYESDLAPEHLQKEFINEFVNDFFDSKYMFLLTQRIIIPCRRKSAA